MGVSRAMVMVALLVAALAPAGADTADIAAAPGPQPGQVTERIACEGDATQSYALYLPTAYAVEKKWPVLIVMDPRGRALLALELFRPRAEELGWIVASSYDTMSDGDWNTNEKAM